MLTVRNLSFSFGPTEVLSDISLDVKAGEVLAITGANGSGKTTLLGCITGELKPPAGSVARAVDYVLLPQQIVEKKRSVRESLLSISPQVCDRYREMAASDELSASYTQALAAFTDLGGYQLLAELERLAADFGFDGEALGRSLETFSEGEKQIFAIIRVLASPAELVLMDEPLNHLDISVRMHLEQVILREKRKGRGFLVVTHDRVFADRVADRTLYIQRGKGITVRGGYSQMIAHLELEFESKRHLAEDMSRKIKKLEREVTIRQTWASRKENSARKQRKIYDGAYLASRAARMAKKAKAAEGRMEGLIKRLEEEKPFVEKKLNLSFAPYEVVNRRVVSARGISKSFGERLIFEDVNLDVSTGQRIALLGPNGSGKTTLLRCLLGESEPDKGQVNLSKYVKYLYLPQDVQSAFSREILIDNLTSDGLDEVVVRQHLGGARLRGDKALQRVSSLSRGELMRAWIAAATLSKAEFLFLDEPTNHLDIESLAVLDLLLDNFPGGLFFISHDRHFITRHSEKIFSLEDRSLVSYDI